MTVVGNEKSRRLRGLPVPGRARGWPAPETRVHTPRAALRGCRAPVTDRAPATAAPATWWAFAGRRPRPRGTEPQSPAPAPDWEPDPRISTVGAKRRRPFRRGSGWFAARPPRQPGPHYRR